jgi:hypothetical protein
MTRTWLRILQVVISAVAGLLVVPVAVNIGTGGQAPGSLAPYVGWLWPVALAAVAVVVVIEVLNQRRNSPGFSTRRPEDTVLVPCWWTSPSGPGPGRNGSSGSDPANAARWTSSVGCWRRSNGATGSPRRSARPGWTRTASPCCWTAWTRSARSTASGACDQRAAGAARRDTTGRVPSGCRLAPAHRAAPAAGLSGDPAADAGAGRHLPPLGEPTSHGRSGSAHRGRGAVGAAHHAVDADDHGDRRGGTDRDGPRGGGGRGRAAAASV